MFPFDQSYELSFQISNDLDQDNDLPNTNTNHFPQSQHVEQDGNNHHHLPLSSPTSRKMRHWKSSREIISKNNNSNTSCNNNDQHEISAKDVAKKRIIHREIERQRRQDMSNLYSSLCSLLPKEYVKGKRSILDHLSEATRYIEDIKKSVKELGNTRDKLKGLSSASKNQISEISGCSSSNTLDPKNDCDMSIHAFSNVIEIKIVVGFGKQDVLPLSRALELLIEQGLSVVSCVSSKINQRWIYLIHCEINDVTPIDSHQLQQRLMSKMTSS